MQKVVILGANGFIGAPLKDTFRNAGWEVIAFSRHLNPLSTSREIQADLFDVSSLKKALTASKPNVVISTAWDTEHGKFWTSDTNPAYQAATLKFAELSFEAGVRTFVGLGTMSEYGASPGKCSWETSPLVPTDIYSKSKIETGLRLKEIGESFGCKTHWLRIFQAFGPNEKSARFAPGLISTLRKGEKFSIRTPNYEMDWIHTADVASAALFTLENELSHFVDIGTGIATKVSDLSAMICKELNLDASLLDYSEQVPGHQKTVFVDPNSELFSAGWSPEMPLRNRIRSLG